MLTGQFQSNVVGIAMGHQDIEQELGVLPALTWDPHLLLHLRGRSVENQRGVLLIQTGVIGNGIHGVSFDR